KQSDPTGQASPHPPQLRGSVSTSAQPSSQQVPVSPHSASSGTLEQPASASQVSTVHDTSSSHARSTGVDTQPSTGSQTSPVQVTASSHSASRGSNTQPEASSQVSVVHAIASSHTGAGVSTHAPASQTAPPLHSPSPSQSTPSARSTWLQVVTSHASSVHGLPSSQCSAVTHATHSPSRSSHTWAPSQSASVTQGRVHAERIENPKVRSARRKARDDNRAPEQESGERGQVLPQTRVDPKGGEARLSARRQPRDARCGEVLTCGGWRMDGRSTVRRARQRRCPGP